MIWRPVFGEKARSNGVETPFTKAVSCLYTNGSPVPCGPSVFPDSIVLQLVPAS